MGRQNARRKEDELKQIHVRYKALKEEKEKGEEEISKNKIEMETIVESLGKAEIKRLLKSAKAKTQNAIEYSVLQNLLSLLVDDPEPSEELLKVEIMPDLSN